MSIKKYLWNVSTFYGGVPPGHTPPVLCVQYNIKIEDQSDLIE
jgi:hypothetical protein